MSLYKEPNLYSVAWFLVGIEEVKYYFFDVFIIKVLNNGTCLSFGERECDEVSEL